MFHSACSYSDRELEKELWSSSNSPAFVIGAGHVRPLICQGNIAYYSKVQPFGHLEWDTLESRGPLFSGKGLRPEWGKSHNVSALPVTSVYVQTVCPWWNDNSDCTYIRIPSINFIEDTHPSIHSFCRALWRKQRVIIYEILRKLRSPAAATTVFHQRVFTRFDISHSVSAIRVSCCQTRFNANRIDLCANSTNTLGCR